tara:strand:- start:22155 stop:22397 length:243 start_codon:yes stop_codon:yes gene_type:complete
MKAIGIIEIENGLTLNNPTLEIEQITYKQNESLVLVECIFVEENAIYKHSRNFTFVASKDMLKSDVIALVNNHNILKVFK